MTRIKKGRVRRRSYPAELPFGRKLVKVIRRIRDLARRHVIARLRTRYTLALEDEVARLRAENRALINSILGVAGIPPMRSAAAMAGRSREGGFAGTRPASPGRRKGRPCVLETESAKVGAGEADAAAGSADAGAESPKRSVRRRTWRQIGRAMEIEDARAARRERESNAEAFPAPRNIVPRDL